MLVGLFSGQGSQYAGMGKSLYDSYDSVKEIYKTGEEILGVPLRQISFGEDQQQKLNQTIYSQPAIFAHSVAAYTVAKEKLSPLGGVAGHSLGEFAALYAAGAYDLEDGFKIIGTRAAAMDKAAGSAKGKMVAILNASLQQVEEACQQAGGLVLPVNLNQENQTVISGDEEGVNKAVAILAAMNIRRFRAVPLAVSSAFHTSMMAPAAAELKAALREVSFSKTTIPFFSNLTGGLLEIKDYPDYFSEQMVSPVRFVQQCAAMADFGVTTAVEFGPKKTVSGLIKKNTPEISVANVDTAEDLTSLKA